jgi:hypothetical protein
MQWTELAGLFFWFERRRGAGSATNDRQNVIPAMEHPRPTSPFDAPKAALQVAWQFRMGAICPAEMWAQLSDVLSTGDVNEILNTLPPEFQEELRQSYRERPLSFSTLDDNPLQRQIENWCLARDSRAGRCGPGSEC